MNLHLTIFAAVIGFAMIWMALDGQMILMAIVGGILFGGGVGVGLFGRD